MRPLGTLLGDAVARARISPEIEATKALGHFRVYARETWGVSAARHMRPEYIKNQAMFVKVTGNAFAAEIKFREREIVAEINRKMKKPVVDRICCLV